ncbi:MAG: hypothetical protein ABIO70_27415, partial [Pseudomonadota bacterium]
GLPGLRWPAARRWAWLGAVAAAAWLALGWPGLHPVDLLHPYGLIERRKGYHTWSRGADARAALVQWALTGLGPDDRIIDCAELRLVDAVLPARLPLVDAPPHHQACMGWILHPMPGSGPTWLLTLHQRDFGTDPRLLGSDQVARAGWEEAPLEGEAGPALDALGIKRWRMTW